MQNLQNSWISKNLHIITKVELNTTRMSLSALLKALKS